MELHRYRLPVYIALVFSLVSAIGGFLLLQRAMMQVDVRVTAEVKHGDTTVVTREEEVTVLAVGDLMLGRSVETKMKVSGDEYVFAKVGDLFKGYDLLFGNLEGPIPEKHVQTPPGSFQFNFRREVAPLLAKQGFDVVSLANNHALDYGQAGFLETQKVLKEAGVAYVGHYSNEKQDIYEKEIRGKKIVMVAFNMIEPSFDQKAAVAWAAEAAKREHDVLFASIHWGAEYVHKPAREQQRLAEALIDAGVDVILGGHPHVPQSISTYKGKTIVYSMGNFIFDQYWSEPTQLGMAVAITIADDKITLRPIPIDLHGSQPREYEVSRVAAWRGWLASISDKELKDMISLGEITQKAE